MNFFGLHFPVGLDDMGKRVISLLHVSRTRAAVAGTIFSILLLLFLLLWDGYVFYVSVKKNPSPVREKRPVRLVTARDLDRAIQILDARAKKSNEILNH